MPVFDKVGGIIVEENVTSEAVIECLAREIPLISAAKGATQALKNGSVVTLDVSRGVVFSGKANII